MILALHLFWRKGYAATSVEDLVEGLNLSRSSLYDTFGDKRTLFLEALRHYSTYVLNTVVQTLNEATSPIAAIQAIFDGLAAGAGSDSGAMGCFMVNSIAELAPFDPDVNEIATTYNAAFQRLLTEALTQDGVTKKHPPEALAAYVFNTIQGMRVLIKSGASKEQAQAIGAITLQNLQ